MRHLSTDEMLGKVQQWMDEHHQKTATRIRIDTEDGDFVQLFVPRWKPADMEDQPAQSGELLTECQRDILQAITDADKRLTNEEVKEALQEDGHIHGESTINMALADLTKRKKLLTNARDARGKGYGLASW